ncbi:MAG: LPS export ABC transporter periplasmic protein LptC [Deltaproteobacteria bacterium]|nr:LPS export ABC transporter periplasmic protein LptC [Deltaproteobacteria bacterium]
MNRKIRLILAVFIALSVAGLAALIYAHYRVKDIKVVINADKGVGVEITGLHYSGANGGGVTWELDAERAWRAKGSEVTTVEGIKAVFHSKDGMPYTLTARQGAFMEADRTLDVTGGVVLESKAGERLTTDSLHYSDRSRDVTTSVPVRITTPAIEITGVGLRFDLDRGKVWILRDVKAVMRGAVS